MRAAGITLALIFAAFTLACGTGKPESPLPPASTPLRTSATDLVSHYRYKSDPHPNEGKRIVVKVYGTDALATAIGETKLVVKADSKPLTRRPELACVMRPTVDLGNADRWGSVWVEGDLHGTVGFADQEWSKKWVELTPQSGRMADRFVLLTDAVFVAEPKD